MAQVAHTDESLKAIADDLKDLVERIEDLRKKMRSAGITALGIDGEKGQVGGRTSLHGFVASGFQALRRAKDEAYLRDVEKKSKK